MICFILGIVLVLSVGFILLNRELKKQENKLALLQTKIEELETVLKKSNERNDYRLSINDEIAAERTKYLMQSINYSLEEIIKLKKRLDKEEFCEK